MTKKPSCRNGLFQTTAETYMQQQPHTSIKTITIHKSNQLQYPKNYGNNTIKVRRSSSLPPRQPTQKGALNIPGKQQVQNRSQSTGPPTRVLPQIRSVKNQHSFKTSSQPKEMSQSKLTESLFSNTAKDNYARPVQLPQSATDATVASKNRKGKSKKQANSLKQRVTDQDYLRFSLRITEDIIKNDLYTNKEMRQVFDSHMEANRGRLDMEKMQKQVLNLCKELDIPLYDSEDNQSTTKHATTRNLIDITNKGFLGTPTGDLKSSKFDYEEKLVYNEPPITEYAVYYETSGIKCQQVASKTTTCCKNTEPINENNLHNSELSYESYSWSNVPESSAHRKQFSTTLNDSPAYNKTIAPPSISNSTQGNLPLLPLIASPINYVKSLEVVEATNLKIRGANNEEIEYNLKPGHIYVLNKKYLLNNPNLFTESNSSTDYYKNLKNYTAKDSQLYMNQHPQHDNNPNVSNSMKSTSTECYYASYCDNDKSPFSQFYPSTATQTQTFDSLTSLSSPNRSQETSLPLTETKQTVQKLDSNAVQTTNQLEKLSILENASSSNIFTQEQITKNHLFEEMIITLEKPNAEKLVENAPPAKSVKQENKIKLQPKDETSKEEETNVISLNDSGLLENKYLADARPVESELGLVIDTKTVKNNSSSYILNLSNHSIETIANTLIQRELLEIEAEQENSKPKQQKLQESTSPTEFSVKNSHSYGTPITSDEADIINMFNKIPEIQPGSSIILARERVKEDLENIRHKEVPIQEYINMKYKFLPQDVKPVDQTILISTTADSDESISDNDITQIGHDSTPNLKTLKETDETEYICCGLKKIKKPKRKDYIEENPNDNDSSIKHLSIVTEMLSENEKQVVDLDNINSVSETNLENYKKNSLPARSNNS